MLEVKVINTFNMYRVPFVAGSFGFCLAFFFRSKQPLFLRTVPLLFLGTFASIYNYQVGQYGVYRNVDSIFTVLTDKRDTEVGLEAYTFLKNLAEDESSKLKERVALRRQREADYEREHNP